MKKINSTAVVSICSAYVLFLLFTTVSWRSIPTAFALYLEILVYMLPGVFLILYLWPLQKHKETGILTCVGCTLINFNFSNAVNVAAKSLDEPTRELSRFDWVEIIPGSLWMIFLLVLGFVLQRRGDFQYMRQVFLLFAVLALMNILVVLKFAFLKDAHLPFITEAPADPYYQGSGYTTTDSSAVYPQDSFAPPTIDSVAPY